LEKKKKSLFGLYKKITNTQGRQERLPNRRKRSREKGRTPMKAEEGKKNSSEMINHAKKPAGGGV